MSEKDFSKKKLGLLILFMEEKFMNASFIFSGGNFLVIVLKIDGI